MSYIISIITITVLLLNHKFQFKSNTHVIFTVFVNH